jgi:hypothetical protein
MRQLKAASQVLPSIVQERPLDATIYLRGGRAGFRRWQRIGCRGMLGVRQLNVQITQPPSALQD